MVSQSHLEEYSRQSVSLNGRSPRAGELICLPKNFYLFIRFICFFSEGEDFMFNYFVYRKNSTFQNISSEFDENQRVEQVRTRQCRLWCNRTRRLDIS